MSFSNPAHHIDRVSIVGEEAEYVKMFDPRPIGANPTLPERLLPTNPVPEVMEALGFGPPDIPRTRSFDLLNGLTVNTWNGNTLNFMAFRDKDHDNTSRYPGQTIRMPRGVIFHCDTNGKGGSPHTIHWHGVEPTPMNDGVGHTSMEIGNYTYQFQPNFIGTYFYHCHRNTMQHFEFGLFGLLIFEPPDAYFASINGADWVTQTIPSGIVTLNSIPVGACLDGKFRTAANLDTLSSAKKAQFHDFVRGDRVYGVAGPGDIGVGNPHAYTVAYDVEALWVLDDRDSNWSENADNPMDTFPVYDANQIPDPVDPINNPPTPSNLGDLTDNVDFQANPGNNGFFAFNDFRADYWFVTGLPVPAGRGGDAVIDTTNFTSIPARANSGKSGTQVAVNATVGQTVLVRCLNAAYNSAVVTFPVDIVIIAWDGRPLGIPPFGKYSEAIEVPANTPIYLTTARRFDALITSSSPVNSHAKVTFHETRGGEKLVTARIPIAING